MARPTKNILRFRLALGQERHYYDVLNNVSEEELWLRNTNEVAHLYGDLKDEGHWKDFVEDVFYMMCDYVHLQTCTKHPKDARPCDICLCHDHAHTCTREDMEAFAAKHGIVSKTRVMQCFFDMVLACTYPDYSDEADVVEEEE